MPAVAVRCPLLGYRRRTTRRATRRSTSDPPARRWHTRRRSHARAAARHGATRQATTSRNRRGWRRGCGPGGRHSRCARGGGCRRTRRCHRRGPRGTHRRGTNRRSRGGPHRGGRNRGPHHRRHRPSRGANLGLPAVNSRQQENRSAHSTGTHPTSQQKQLLHRVISPVSENSRRLAQQTHLGQAGQSSRRRHEFGLPSPLLRWSLHRIPCAACPTQGTPTRSVSGLQKPAGGHSCIRA